MPPHSSPLRVLLVTARYFPYIGGIETHVHEVGRRLARAGMDVTVLTTDPGGRLPAEEEAEGVHILRVPAWPGNRDYYLAPRVSPIVAGGRWDLVHCQGCHTFVPPLAMLAARRARIPYVVTIHAGGHSSRLRNGVRGLQFTLLGPLLRHATRLIGVSAYEIELFAKRLGLPHERFTLIPNGVEPLIVAEAQETVSDRELIVSVGRLERYKGHHRVIAALPKLIERRPNARLLILGTGPYEPELWSLARRRGVADRVEIRAIPAGDRQAMARQLLQASLVVLLSDCESHPVAVMEALTLRRPVLVADTSGLRELAERGLVRAIPLSSTAEEVAAAMIGELDAPMAPRQVAFPTWDDCARELAALYASAARRSPCAS